MFARLREANYLTESAHDALVSALTQKQSSDDRRVSALHILEQHSFRNLWDMLFFLSADSGIPLIELSRFEPQQVAFRHLDADVMLHHNVLCFDTLDQSLLTVVLNPYDQSMCKWVVTQTGCDHVFYMCMASDFDLALNRIVEAVQSQPETDDVTEDQRSDD